MTRPLITFGMATYKEASNTRSTVMSLRLQLRKLLPVSAYQIVCINNAPNDIESTLKLDHLFKRIPNGKLINYGDRVSTAVRDLVFTHSDSLFTFCMDCHVLLDEDGVKSLIKYLQANPDCRDLMQGMLWLDDLRTRYTHMNPVWQEKMYGVWGFDKQGNGHEPFEIPMHGLGLFGCATDVWPGINKLFTGFGGEEGYVHDKFRAVGQKTLCLPWLGWVHEFRKPGKSPIVNRLDDRIYNYYIARRELLKTDDDVTEHFCKFLKEDKVLAVRQRALSDFELTFGANKDTTKPTSVELLAAAEHLANTVAALPQASRNVLLSTLSKQSPEMASAVRERLADMRAVASGAG